MPNQKNWIYLHPSEVTTENECLDVVLSNRQITDRKQFFNPKSPFKWALSELDIDKDALEKVIARIKLAIQQQENVVIFGDYDADGVCATAILWEAIKDSGLITRPFIPHRMKHGYGLSISALEEIFADSKPSLVITVDNGIVAHPALEWLSEQGVDVIVTDHHQPDSKPLQVSGLVHSTRISGAGVAWVLSRQLSPATAQQQLDLLGLATLADQMPLIGPNRSFVTYGIEQLKDTKRLGIVALQQAAGSKGEITSQSVQFGLIPRINAMGRLQDGMDSLRLLCVKKQQHAEQLADLLHQTNIDRQQLTAGLLDLALSQAAAQAEQHLVIVSDTSFHEGVIGLLAGKLLESTSKPVIAFHLGEKTTKASVRSIPGLDIIEFLRNQAVPYLELGGHALAAGFLIATSDVGQVTQMLHQSAKTTILAESLVPKLQLEAKLSLGCVTPSLVKLLDSCQPFGKMNPTPFFGVERLMVTTIGSMGSDRQHLKLQLRDGEGHVLTAVYWRQGVLANIFAEGDLVRVAGRLELNEWKHRQTVQLVLQDIQLQPE